MKIVIIGDGKVGYKLAKQLSSEKYDIILIDNNEEKLRKSIERMDVFCVAGEGGSVEVQQRADVPHADLVIACTSTDECNMLSCLIARRLGARHTIARVRNPIYYKQIDFLKKDLHLSMVVNPELIVAGDITRLLLFPDASKVENFVKGRVELVEFPIHCGKLEGLSLSELYARFQVQVLVCAVESGETVLIPDGDYILKAGDKLHIAASHQNMEQFFKKIALRKEKIKNAMICGGGRVAYYLASQLCNLGMNVKIIERNRERCEELCELLPQATIINGDATEHDLLIEEGIEKTDAFIALTGMDEENIIMSLFASKQSVSKVIVKINEDRRAMMIDELGLDSIVSAKTATADAILGYVRARRNSQCSANVETMYQLLDGRVEALEFIIKSENAYTGVPLKDLNLKANNIIACIARGRKIIIPNGDDSIQVGDSVVIITMTKQIRDLDDILVKR